SFMLYFFVILPPPPRPTLFPYTTLFRSMPVAPCKAALGRPFCCPRTGAGVALRSACMAHDVLSPLFDKASVANKTPFLPYEVPRSEEHTSELQSRENLVCRLLLEKKKNR